MKNPFLKRFSRHLRARWRARALASHGVAIVADTKNGVLAVQPGDFNVSRSLLMNGEYDWPQISWLKPLVTRNSRLIFAGAHIGAVLVPLVRAAESPAVLAYEPSPQNFRLLNMNLGLNHIQGVVTRNVALGERQGRIPFTQNNINTGNSRIAQIHGEINVAIDTLDRCVPSDWDSIDLIVMDIEGSEVAAMRGAAAVLAKTRFLYVEFAPEQLREQATSPAEFIELAEKYFRSAYIFGSPIIFLGPGKFAGYLEGLQDRPGLLLNVLLTQDLEPNAERVMGPPV